MIAVGVVLLVLHMDIMAIIFENDCANFVSQCLIEGGHQKLRGSSCKSFSCGVQLGSRN